MFNNCSIIRFQDSLSNVIIPNTIIPNQLFSEQLFRLYNKMARGTWYGTVTTEQGSVPLSMFKKSS